MDVEKLKKNDAKRFELQNFRKLVFRKHNKKIKKNAKL